MNSFMGLVKDKVALVTGGGSGIGRATALLFAAEGAFIAIADRNEETVHATAADVAAAGGVALTLRADISDPLQVEAMVSSVVQRFGRLDCAVNNAGICDLSGRAAEMSDALWHAMISVNLTGTAFCIKREAMAMISHGRGGSIVNISSISGLKGHPSLGGYVAAKHGVIGLTKSAALDHARDGVRVNAVCPGLVITAITKASYDAGQIDANTICPIGRPGRAEEIAEAVVWLCSDRASFVTGAVLPVDGGHMAG